MCYYTEEQILRERINYRLQQLSPEQVDFCKAEAHRLFHDPYITHEPGDSELKWLDCITENVYIMEMRHQAMRCAELGDE